MARVAFVMEQTLGHVTHARNLASVLEARPEISPVWLPIEFGVQGVARFLPLYRGNWSVRASWRARRALDTAFRSGPIDALLFHTQVTSLFSVGRMRRTPTVISLDATPLNFDEVTRYGGYDHKIAGEGLLDRQKFLMNRRALQAAATVVPWSEWARRSLVDEYGVNPDRITVLAPGANSAFFELGKQRVASDAPPHADGPARILFVGGEWRRKGGPQLLEALAGLPRDSWQLDVVTRDPIPAMPSVIVHHGIGPNSPQLLELFRQADLFVLPSLGECLAVVLMEATAAGLPVVTTNVGALSEAVRQGETGTIVPPNDVASLRAALAALVADPARRVSMGRGGHALALERFVATDNNRQMLDIIAEHARVGSRPRRAA